MTDAPAPRLLASTRPLDRLTPLFEHADATDPLVWGRGDDLLVGVGDTLRLTFHGPNRILDAAAAWARLTAAAEIDNPIGVPGTGLIAFGSFTFASDSSQTSVLLVPRFVFGARDGNTFVTEIRFATEPSAPEPTPSSVAERGRVAWQPSRDAAPHQAAVRGALSYIRAGSVKKVVLARAVSGQLPEQLDVRAVLARLHGRYPGTWVFAVDGLVGASPETLIAMRHGHGSLQVLAGTLDHDQGDGQTLLDSEKDLAEHQFAVNNVTESLQQVGVAGAQVSEPFAVELPELWHLASDIEFDSAAGLLDLVHALHPTAAVAGTPTEAALKVIAAFEPIDRGRYAGPVGWVDAVGNGEWAVALRCAQLAGDTATAYAGGGIVAGSDPALEYAETELKLKAIRSAL